MYLIMEFDSGVGPTCFLWIPLAKASFVINTFNLTIHGHFKFFMYTEVDILSRGIHSGTQEPLRREKGSGKTKCITLEANVRSVHFLGREESEPF